LYKKIQRIILLQINILKRLMNQELKYSTLNSNSDYQDYQDHERLVMYGPEEHVRPIWYGPENQ
jgi:hypothetical protein